MPEFDSTLSFREVSGFPGYAVGSDGSVWCCRGRGGRKGLPDPADWRPLCQTPDKDGYLRVGLYGGGRRWCFPVHRLVLEAFAGPCPEGRECLHGAGGTADNSVGNVRWDTHQANIDDRTRQGNGVRGERHRLAKLTPEKVREARRLVAGGMTRCMVAGLLGVSAATISLVVLRKAWRHVEP